VGTVPQSQIADKRQTTWGQRQEPTMLDYGAKEDRVTLPSD
jgi:hypothetical protein